MLSSYAQQPERLASQFHLLGTTFSFEEENQEVGRRMVVVLIMLMVALQYSMRCTRATCSFVHDSLEHPLIASIRAALKV